MDSHYLFFLKVLVCVTIVNVTLSKSQHLQRCSSFEKKNILYRVDTVCTAFTVNRDTLESLKIMDPELLVCK